MRGSGHDNRGLGIALMPGLTLMERKPGINSFTYRGPRREARMAGSLAFAEGLLTQFETYAARRAESADGN